MKSIAYGVLLSVLLAACSQTPTKEATIEDRGQPANGKTAAKDGKDGMETRGLAGSGAEGTALEGKAPSKNAAGPLGKRVVYFDFDSAAIREEYRPVLEAHSGFLKANKGAKVILQGHTDERGSREYNVALGQRRADAVKQSMSLLGVPEAQMESVSFGEEKPAAEGHEEANWQQNRRAEIVYDGE